MGKIKVAVSALLFVGSCGSLLATHGVISALLQSYASAPGVTPTGHVPAFTSLALSLMPQSALLCFGALLLSLALLGLTVLRAQTRESKLYWATVLSSINYYFSGFLLGVVLVGYFMLPKLANGI